MDVTTSNYEAELGRAGGAVTNIVLKSGTNEFHGAGYWFNSVSALGARSFFQVAKPVTTYNYLQLGGIERAAELTARTSMVQSAS